MKRRKFISSTIVATAIAPIFSYLGKGRNFISNPKFKSQITTKSHETRSDIPYRVEKGVIICDKGIPEPPRWFADSRLAFGFDGSGITQVDYYNPASKTFSKTVFLRQLWDGFRYYVEQNLLTYKPEYSNSKIWPYGIESEWNFRGIILKHRLMAINESIVLQLIVPDEVPADLRLKIEFYEAFGLSNGSPDDLRYFNGSVIRKWFPWQFFPDSNILLGGFSENSNDHETGANLFIGIAADFKISQYKTFSNAKHILKSLILESGNIYNFVISFNSSKEKLIDESQALTTNLDQLIREQTDRYQKIVENSPVLISPYYELNDLVSLIPMYHESLKVKGYPGAIRAKTTDYWVWGWDGMTCNNSTAYWGDLQHIKDMLEFYKSTADPEKGIAAAYQYNMSIDAFSALTAQSMYITLLQLYYTYSGDLAEVEKYFAFAKQIFKQIISRESSDLGLCESRSLFPDFTNFMLETGHDLSSFNNTVFYCAVRSMEYLSAIVGDMDQQEQATSFVRKIEKNYLLLFFDPHKDYVVSSIDSKTLQQRSTYCAGAIRWENNYIRELTESINNKCLNFYEENLITKTGIREVPIWSYSYDKDANQLHCWWPATNEYFSRLINLNNRNDLTEQWIEWVSYWSKHLTVPEAISCYFETDEPEFDRWNSLKGSWQAFSMRPWYQGIIHGVVGVDVDAGGITFYPYSGKEMTLKGLNYKNKKFDIEMTGCGPFIETIDVGGMLIRGTNKLPTDLHPNIQHVKVRVNRTEINPYPLSIVYGTAVELSEYSYANESIKAMLRGAGTCRLKIRAQTAPHIKIDGKYVNSIYNPELQLATVELNMRKGKLQHIQVSL
jgi:hypothetical protein